MQNQSSPSTSQIENKPKQDKSHTSETKPPSNVANFQSNPNSANLSNKSPTIAQPKPSKTTNNKAAPFNVTSSQPLEKNQQLFQQKKKIIKQLNPNSGEFVPPSVLPIIPTINQNSLTLTQPRIETPNNTPIPSNQQKTNNFSFDNKEIGNVIFPSNINNSMPAVKPVTVVKNEEIKDQKQIKKLTMQEKLRLANASKQEFVPTPETNQINIPLNFQKQPDNLPQPIYNQNNQNFNTNIGPNPEHDDPSQNINQNGQTKQQLVNVNAEPFEKSPVQPNQNSSNITDTPIPEEQKLTVAAPNPEITDQQKQQIVQSTPQSTPNVTQAIQGVQPEKYEHEVIPKPLPPPITFQIHLSQNMIMEFMKNPMRRNAIHNEEIQNLIKEFQQRYERKRKNSNIPGGKEIGGMVRSEDPHALLKKKIKESENKWVEYYKKHSANQNELKLQLNALTPDNYDILKDEIKQYLKMDKKLCEQFIEMLIDKACQEQNYISLYASLCQYMKNDQDIRFDDVLDASQKEKNYFLGSLIENVQKLYSQEKQMYVIYETKIIEEQGKEKRVEKVQLEFKNMKPENRQKYLLRKKERSMLLVQFIGELFLRKILAQQVMFMCAQQMLYNFFSIVFDNTDPENEDYHDFENYLEGAIELFDKIGKEIEERMKKKTLNQEESNQVTKEYLECLKQRKTPKSVENFNKINIKGIIEILQYIKEHQLASNRLCNLIYILADRQDKGWPQRLFGAEGPKKITQIHDDYFQQQHIKSIEYADEYKQIEDQGKQKPTNTGKGGYQGNNNKYQASNNQNSSSVSKGPVVYAKAASANVVHEQVKNNSTNNQQEKMMGNKLFGPSQNINEEVIQRVKNIYEILSTLSDETSNEIFDKDEFKNSFKNKNEKENTLFLKLLLEELYKCLNTEKNQRIKFSEELIKHFEKSSVIDAVDTLFSNAIDDEDFPFFRPIISNWIFQTIIHFKFGGNAFKYTIVDKQRSEELNQKIPSLIEDTIDLLIKKAEYNLKDAEAIFAEVLKTLVTNGFDQKEWDQDIANRFTK